MKTTIHKHTLHYNPQTKTITVKEGRNAEKVFKVKSFQCSTDGAGTRVVFEGTPLKERQVQEASRVVLTIKYVAKFMVLLSIAASIDRYYNEGEQFALKKVAAYAVFKVLEAFTTIVSEFFVEDMIVWPYQRDTTAPFLSGATS